MEKIFLTNGSGKFFDIDNADVFKTTESEDCVYHTCHGSWVLVEKGETEEITELSPEEAAQWFVENEYEFNDIPDELQKFAGEEI